MSLRLLKPQLNETRGNDVVLLGGQCQCGQVFFPVQSFGFEQCGKYGAAINPKKVEARGKIVAYVNVHTPGDRRRADPFTVARIAMDDVIVVRTLLRASDRTPDLRVSDVLIPVIDEAGNDALDLRFVTDCLTPRSIG